MRPAASFLASREPDAPGELRKCLTLAESTVDGICDCPLERQLRRGGLAPELLAPYAAHRANGGAS